jgi:hypothetical protein
MKDVGSPGRAGQHADDAKQDDAGDEDPESPTRRLIAGYRGLPGRPVVNEVHQPDDRDTGQKQACSGQPGLDDDVVAQGGGKETQLRGDDKGPLRLAHRLTRPFAGSGRIRSTFPMAFEST